MNDFCQIKPIIAIKGIESVLKIFQKFPHYFVVIRLTKMAELNEILSKIPDLKIIVTFRDPRGIYSSRKERLTNRNENYNPEQVLYYTIFSL